MYEVILKSYEPVLDNVLPEIESALPAQTKLQWNFANAKKRLGTEELMMLYMGDVDLVLVQRDKIDVTLPEGVKIQAVLNGPEKETLVLISLKELQFDFWSIDQRRKYGQVHIVGFGPGNPELLTIKAHRLLQEADVIFYDDLIDQNYLDQFKGEKRYVGKRKGQHSARQENINELLYQAALSGNKVVRIKGGDPLIFGRGGEEYHYLDQRFIEAEIVPGITAALAAAADGVIPLTSRGLSTSVAFALGHDASHNNLPHADTLVFYMAASQQKKWARRLIKEGWPANIPVAAIRNASLPAKEIKRYTLDQLQSEEELLPAPCLVIVGHTATENVKSLGQKWLYTGSDVNDYKDGGMVVHNPMIDIKSIEPNHCEVDLLKNLNTFDRLIFASPFAVKEFFKALYSLGLDARALHGLKISSIGRSTSAKLKKYGLRIPPETSQNNIAAMLKVFENDEVRGERILLPCSVQRFDKLPEGLRLLGNKVKELCLYENMIPENAVRHNLDEFTGVVFTSPTTIKHFFEFYGSFPSHLVPICRGETAEHIFSQLYKEAFVS
nr:uroporphyrinogen-III C-methyltransferase [uncultured Carboxylicivirga sp.]